MKNQMWKIYGWLVVAGLFALPVRADNSCMEGGPYTTVEGCLQTGTFVPGVLTPTSINTVVGQTILPPAAYGYSMTSGSELDYVTFDCPDSGPNYFTTNQVSYAFGSVYFVPPLPMVAWTPGTYTYEAYVIATGSPCQPLTNDLGTVAICVATNNPDVLLDVDFGGGTASSKTGYAAIGDSPNDFWNYYIAGGDLVSGALANLSTAEGNVSPVGLLVTNLPVPGTNGSSDPMYDDYLSTNAVTATVTLTNLPTGTWNVFLYSDDGNFTLTSGGTNYGTQTSYDSSPASTPLIWLPGVQYVEFQNVIVTNGQPVTITINPGINGVAMISGLQVATVSHTPRPLFSPSSVVAWGRNSFGQTNVPSGLTNVMAIAGGYFHSLALKSDGTVAAWGGNNYGQISVPSGLAGVVAIAAGWYHSLALRSDGTVVVWGNNAAGQCNVPLGLSNVVAVAGGGAHSLALKNDGMVVAWGDNSYGQTNVPSGLANVVAIAAGDAQSLALKNDGTVVAWGYNDVPSGLNNVVAIAAGYDHDLALKSDGTVVAWGDNSYGQTNVPAGLSNVVAIAAGEYHSLALKGDGSAVAWGDNSYGQTNVPAGLSNVVAIAAGEYHNLALRNPTVPAGQIASLYRAGAPGTFNVSADSDYDGVSDYQELADRTDPNNFNDFPHIRLGYWPFDDTNAWVGAEGQLPLVATNVDGVPSWSTNAVLIDTNSAAILNYRDVETNGNANINLRTGTIRFWFKPDWSSTNAGGTGPVDCGRLIEMGNQGTGTGWWTLQSDTNGDTLNFITQTNGVGMTNLTTTISWPSNIWHQIVLTYSVSNSSLYIDGQAVVTNGLGVQYWPNAVERSAGFCIGSDATGNNQARGVFDELDTFNYPLDAASILANYEADWNLDSNGDGLSNILENELGINPYGNYSSNGLTSDNGLQVFTPLK